MPYLYPNGVMNGVENLFEAETSNLQGVPNSNAQHLLIPAPAVEINDDILKNSEILTSLNASTDVPHEKIYDYSETKLDYLKITDFDTI